MKTIFTLFTLLLFISKPVLANTQQLLQLIDYVGVDYSSAIKNGQVTNKSEYAEMMDFSAGISQQVSTLPEQKIKKMLIEQSKILNQWIKQKESANKIKKITREMHHNIINAYNVIVVPRKQPDLKKAKSLYAEQCASCHGTSGYGDGLASKGMEPPPINFHDTARYQQRSLYGLHSTIKQGVADTAMKAYDQLSDQDVWSLAFYVGGFATPEASKTINISNSPLKNIRALTLTTPIQAEELYGKKGANIMASLRHYPELIFQKKSNLGFSKIRLADALAEYKKGNKEKAYEYSVEAYLEGYELSEKNLNAFDPSLRLKIETAMTGLRNKIRKGNSVEIIENEINAINKNLGIAENILASKSLSGETAFASAFFILLREGLEALLIIAALAAFLVRTKRRDGLRFIHFGWISALILGLATWWASVSLINISGASREITEGVAALVAATVLLYVGFWMHDKSSAAKWKKFIDDSMHKALTSGTLWTLSGLSFIAVYREVFETILFYQALWAQTNEVGQNMAFSGFLSAVAVLVVLGWLIMRYSVRLPLRQFFSVTGGLMFFLATIFAGKGIAALQEAGIIISSPVDFIRIDLLGIYPNLQGLLVQLVLIIVAVYLWNKKASTK